VMLITHPHLVPRSWKSRAVPLLHRWARVACYRVKPYLNLYRHSSVTDSWVSATSAKWGPFNFIFNLGNRQ